MNSISERASALKQQILAAEKELQHLKTLLAEVEETQTIITPPPPHEDGRSQDGIPPPNPKWPLSSEEYQRYGRQMIVPNIGIQGQLRLKSSKVLIIGAGGLGCPAAAYIAGCGVGTLGLVDGDEVEISNLHRQILHSTARVGMKKVDSAIHYLTELNPNVKYIPHREHLTPQNASSIVSQYDLVLDCTDHPTSRYLISDICILLSKPLISASALRTDGQLIVLNSPPLPAGNPAGGPCYRCIFPKPPPAESVVSCGDGGIIGPVVGTMGVLQAVEAVKMISSGKLSVGEKEGVVVGGDANANAKASSPTSMLIFSANTTPPFRNLRMRGRRDGCFACSASRELSLESLREGHVDYVLFCGITSPVKLLSDSERIEARSYAERRSTGEKHLLVDVREKVQFEICHLEGSINIPFSSFPRRKQKQDAAVEKEEKEERPDWIPTDLSADAPIYLVCRLGNDSQVIARRLLDAGLGSEGRYIGDIKGGLKSWKAQVDDEWPDY